MYATTQPLSRVVASIPTLASTEQGLDWPGDIDDDPAYLAWLETQYDAELMRRAAISDGSRPGLWG